MKRQLVTRSRYQSVRNCVRAVSYREGLFRSRQFTAIVPAGKMFHHEMAERTQIQLQGADECALHATVSNQGSRSARLSLENARRS
jgi:hypothetical protein